MEREDVSPLAQARLASALTLEDAAQITGMSVTAYQQIEERPFMMTLGEFRALCSELNTDGRNFIESWLQTLFGISYSKN